MPSNKKKFIRARMAKNNESRATAVRNSRGVPKLPGGPTCEWFDSEGFALPEDGTRPQFERVDIQGDFDPNDLSRAWVPSTAFHSPSMPRHPSLAGAKRVLSLKEYIAERRQRTGCALESVNPGPAFMGKVMSVILCWAPRKPDGRQP